MKFAKIRSSGFVESRRRGPTGIGHTLEQLLGLSESNLALPDMGEVEIKAHRVGCPSMITLFTFNRKAWVVKPLYAVRKYGTMDSNGRLGLYFTMSTRPNSSGLFLTVTDEDVWVQHVSGEVIVKWSTKGIADQFRKKIPALILVSAETEQRGGREYFRFFSAKLLTGTSPELVGDQIRIGNILVDLRLHDKGTRARNHGTGFRAYQGNLDKVFTKIVEL